MNKNSIYIATALFIFTGATGLAVFYAYLTKTQAEGKRVKTFDPLVLQEENRNSLNGVFSNSDDVPLEKTAGANTEAKNYRNTNKHDAETSPKDTPKDSGKEVVRETTIEKIYDAPVAGYSILKKETGLTVRIVERARGNIFDYDTVTKESSRITNTTIPGVFESFFNLDGSQVIFRYLDEEDAILTLVASIAELKEQKDEGGAKEVSVGTYLPINIQNVATNDSSIAYAVQAEDGSTQVVITDFAGTKPKRIFKTPITGWQIAWPQKSTLTLTQNASAQTPGYAYTVDTKTGLTQKIVSDTRALTLLFSPYTATFLASMNTKDGQLTTFIKSTDKLEKLTLGKAIVPEKCAFSSASQIVCGVSLTMPKNMPDIWYQGRKSLSDVLVFIDSSSGSITDIINTTKAQTDGLDVINLSVSPDGKYIFFLDKKTGALWMVHVGDKK